MKCQRCKIHLALNTKVLLGGLRVTLCLHCLNDWQAYMNTHPIMKKATDLLARKMLAELNDSLTLAEAAMLTADEDALHVECFALSEQWFTTDPIRALQHDQENY